MKNSKKIVANTIILYIKLFLGIAIGLYTTRLILNALGETDYGIYALVGGVIGMLAFIQSSLSQASVRYIAHSMGSGDVKFMNKTYNTTIVIHYFIGIVLILLLELLGYFMFEFWLNIPDERMFAAKVIYQFMIVTAFVAIISVPFDAIISSKENFLALSIIDIFGNLLSLAIAIYISYYNQNALIVFGFLMLLQQLVVRILKQWYSRTKYKEFKVQLKKSFNRKLAKEILSFSGWNLVSTGGIIVSKQMKSVLLNMFFGVNLNAADGIAKSLSSKMNTFVTSMSNAFTPQIQKNEGAGNRDKMLQLTFVIAKLGIIVTGIFAIPVLIEMPMLLKIWLKNVPGYADVFARLIIIDIIIRRCTFAIPSALKAIGKIKEINTAVGIITILSIPVAYFLYKMGLPPETIYFVTIVSSLLLGLNRLYYGKKIAGINLLVYFKQVILKAILPLLLTTVIALIPFWYMNPTPMRLLLTLFLSFTSSLVFIRYLGLSKKEYNTIATMIRQSVLKFRNK